MQQTLFDLQSETLKETDLFERFLVEFNRIRKMFIPLARFIRPTNKHSRARFAEILKTGITIQDLIKVCENAFNDEWLAKHKWKWITPDYILRDRTIQRFVDIPVNNESEMKNSDNDFGYEY